MKLEKIIYSAGRLRGMFEAGLKSVNAPLSDPTAWGGGYAWGEGLLTGTQKPGDKRDIAKWFTSWAYVCAVTNANARAAIPTELMVAADTKGKAYKTITTRKVNKAKRKYLDSLSTLRPWLIKAEDVEEVTDHPYIELMQRPNPYLSEADLKYLTSLFMDLCGEAYWYIGVKDKLGVPRQIWVIPAQYIKPIPGKTLKDFISGYEYQRGNQKEILDVNDIVHFHVPNPLNDFSGFSCLRGVADAVYVNSKMFEFEEAVFENKARIGGVLETESKLSAPEVNRLQESWKKYEGAAKTGKTVVLPPGMKYTRDAMTPDELSFIEGKRITAEEICVAFGTPKALFDPNAIRANVEGAQYTHAKYGIQPWLMRYDDTLNGDFIPIYDDTNKLFVVSQNPVPEDKDYLLRKRTADVAAGVSTINEERADDGKEPVEGGDMPLVSGMLIPLDQAVAEPEPEPAPIIVAPGKPTPDEDGDTEGDIDTGNEGKAMKLAEMVLAKLKEKLGEDA